MSCHGSDGEEGESERFSALLLVFASPLGLLGLRLQQLPPKRHDEVLGCTPTRVYGSSFPRICVVLSCGCSDVAGAEDLPVTASVSTGVAERTATRALAGPVLIFACSASCAYSRSDARPEFSGREVC